MEWIAPLVTLVLLEVVLGLDNVIFISIIASRLPPDQQKKARIIGLTLAMVLRLILLALISVILKLEGNLFTVAGNDISGKDLVLIGGGLFLIYKSAAEIYHKTEGDGGLPKKTKAVTFRSVLFQILLLDLVFSVDSIITAIGMVSEIWIMYTAVIITVAIMLFAAGPISNFVNRHPAFKMLALSFLLLIGVSLLAEGLDYHIPKGYIYFSMAFALLVDIIQMRSSGKSGSSVAPPPTQIPVQDNSNQR